MVPSAFPSAVQDRRQRLVQDERVEQTGGQTEPPGRVGRVRHVAGQQDASGTEPLGRLLPHPVRRVPHHTKRTVTDPSAFRAALAETVTQGWALVDQELELGLRAVAAPITGRGGRTIAALSVSSASARTALQDLRGRCLPLCSRRLSSSRPQSPRARAAPRADVTDCRPDVYRRYRRHRPGA